MKRSAWRYLWTARDIRNRLLITVGLLAIYRFAAHVPVPGVNREAITALMEGGGASISQCWQWVFTRTLPHKLS
jgi:preprotein translocase subunit SecY